MDDSITSDISEVDANCTASLTFLNTAQIVSSAVLVILQNVLLLLITLLHWIAGYVYIALQWCIFYTPLIVQGVQWVGYSVFGLTRYTDDIILSLSEFLYHVIDTSLDTLECCAVKLQIVLPYCAALPIQVIKILLDWSKLVGSVFTYIIPNSFYTTQTIIYLNELNLALCDISQVVWVILKSVLSQGTNFLFNLLISLITSAKYIAYFTIRVLQISCCQVLPTMFDTLWSSIVLVFDKLVNVPHQLVFNFFVFIDYYEIEVENVKLILQLSVQLILSLFYYIYYYIVQILLFIFQPLLSLVEFTIYILHAAFSSVVPGGLVTILIGLITFWKWYNPTQPHPSPTTPPPNTLQFRPPAPPTAPLTPEEELQDQLDSEREQKLCVICTVEGKCAVLLPCRHCCLCMECSDKLMGTTQPLCPLCRKTIANIMQIYL